MEKVYLAHRSEDQREQTVSAHLNAASALCAKFSSAFGAGEQGRLAGLAHDIGKYSDAFQRRINGSGIRVDHATAGALECVNLGQIFAAFAVAGHHGGLPDGGSRTDSPDQGTFCGRMNRANAGKLEPYSVWKEEITLPSPPIPSWISSNFEGMFFTRMLYSSLVDADFLDTEEFMDGVSVRGGGGSIETLDQRLQDYISGWFPPKNPLNEQRCALLSRCIQQGEVRSPGLFTLTLPTGSGKTVASLAFALRHAKAHGLRRVVYVLPYTSIIEQNAQVFRDILGSENVLEHHSGVLYDLEENPGPQTIRMAKATENWDMPVVVTTAVQFFESLFAARSSKCRKLHNLAGSVIIFDEAQMLPVPYLRPCVAAIAQMVRHYRASAVLCTATQPALGQLFQEFLPETPPAELCPPGTYLDRRIRDWMCGNFYDIRTFGAVMTTFVKAALNCGQVRGPVQLGFARSVEPIVPQEVTITRVAITTEADAEKKGTEMGRKYIVPYGLYRCEGYVSANLARKATGFSEEDLELLWDAILNMFENDRSAARGKMAVRELIVFKHDSELGCAPAWKLFESVQVQRVHGDTSAPARSYKDYQVTVDEASLPAGVACRRLG